MHVNKIPFQPTHTPEHTSAAISWLESKRAALNKKKEVGNSSSRNAFACFIPKETNKLHEGAGPCHGFLSGTGKKNTVLVATTTMPALRCNVADYGTQFGGKNVNEEANKVFLEYLVLRSPASRFIVETTPDMAFELGIILSSEAPSNFLAMACIMSRHIREWHGGVQGWHYLVTEKGVSEDLAFILAFQTTLFPKVSTGLDISSQMLSTFYSVGNGHRVFDNSLTIEGVQNWLDRNALKVNQPYSKETSYSGVDKAFNPGDYNSQIFSVDLAKNLQELKAGGKIDKPLLRMPFGNYKAGPVTSQSKSIINTKDFLDNIHEVLSATWRF